MAGFEIREATPADSRFIGDMLVEALNWHPVRRRPRAQLVADGEFRRYIEGWMRPGDAGVVAVDGNGAPIGACWYRLFAPDEAGHGGLGPRVPELTLGVVSVWRAQGAGRALLRAAVDLARTQGYQRLSLSVERENYARRLYVSEGFATVSSGPDSDTMVRRLR